MSPLDFLQQPSWPGMVQPGNISNLFDRGQLINPDKSISTTVSKSWKYPEGEVLLPTVVDGKKLTDKQAQQRYRDTGQHLGIFSTPDAADNYAMSLHNAQAQTIWPSIATNILQQLGVQQ